MASEEHAQDSGARVNESERWQIWLDAARLSKKNGKLAEAEAGYRLAIELNPKSIEAWTELCALLLQQRRETDAEIIGKTLLKLSGGKGLSWAQLRGQLREKYLDKEPMPSGSPEAKEIAVKAKKEDTIDDHDSSMAYPSKQAHTLLERQPFPEYEPMDRPSRQSERPDRKSSADRKPKQPVAEKASQRIPQASRTKTIERTDASGKTPSEWLSFAKLYSKQGKYPDAERALRNALYIEKDNAEVALQLAEVLYELRRYDEAADLFEEVIDSEPKNARLRYLQGMCYVKLKKEWEASQAFYKCVVLNERFIDAWAELGISLSKQGRHEQARKALLKALKERKNNPRLLTFYGVSLIEQGQLARAENVFRMAIGTDSEYAPAWEQLSRVLELQGKREPANQAHNKARTIASRRGSSILLE